MINIFYLIIFNYLFFLPLNSVKVSNLVLSKSPKVESLLHLAADISLENNIRIMYANLALKIVELDKKNESFTDNSVELANIFYSLNERKQYLYVANMLYKDSLLKNNLEGIAWASFSKGTYFYNEAEYDSSYFYFTKAEKATTDSRDKYLLGFILSSKASILNIKKDYINSEIISVKAVKIGIDENSNLLIYSCYLNLGSSSLALKNFENALLYFKKASEIVEELQEEPKYTTMKAQVYNFISDVYMEKKEYKNAITNAKQALNFSQLKDMNLEMYGYLTNKWSYSNFKLNKLSSDKGFLEILKIADSIKSKPLQIFTKMHLAEYHLKNKNFAKALQYGSEARTQAHKTTFFDEELKLLLLLSEIDAKNSLEYMRRHIELNDSLHNVERATRDKYTRIEFETDEITTARNTAEEKNSFLENRIWMIGIFSILTVLVIVLWFITRSQKAKTRQLLLEQKQQLADEEIYQLMLNQQQKIEEGKTIEKQRISLDLHDNVMGKLSAIRMNLYPIIMTSEIENKDIFYDQLNDIQQVEKEIRGVAHDLNANLFAEDVSFIAVVKEFFSKIKLHTNIQFDLQMGETIAWESISSTVKINLYRIIQEALQNIEKYAEAKNVSVTMSQIDHQVYIVIVDDGIGFDTNAKNEGIGLQNMKTRMQEISGTFSIQSTPGEGTKISLIVPV